MDDKLCGTYDKWKRAMAAGAGAEFTEDEEPE